MRTSPEKSVDSGGLVGYSDTVRYSSHLSTENKADALPHLEALRAERPQTKIGQVRWAWPEIRAALATGHSLKCVWQRLRADGIDIQYKRLSEYIGRLEREAKNPQSRPTAPLPSDPAANLHGRLGRVHGFDYGGTGKKEDLI